MENNISISSKNSINNKTIKNKIKLETREKILDKFELNQLEYEEAI